ncbi:MAG: hypothetical protein H6712_25815 [Myxococcales bacterium]|nr:hypothetical protein [Myxococcales bacterium]MCB9717293.1 hypothetical protein [Myxococcales bacterium]
MLEGLGPSPRRCDSRLPAGPVGRTRARGRSETGELGRRRLRCRECAAVISSERARIEVAGAHAHTFVNPAGFVFEIGCFRSAPGCVGAGPSEAFFSWFPGYAWRVQLCRGCGAQLGWSYGARPDFFGLVLDRLREDEDDA